MVVAVLFPLRSLLYSSATLEETPEEESRMYTSLAALRKFSEHLWAVAAANIQRQAGRQAGWIDLHWVVCSCTVLFVL